jgi:hypothetical protein
MTTRREVLIGAAGLAAAAPLATAAQAGSAGGVGYDYLFVEVPQRSGGAGGPAPFIAHLTALLPTIAAAGGEALGWFSPLIGWTSEQLAVTIRWPERAPERERVIAALHAPVILKRDFRRSLRRIEPDPRSLSWRLPVILPKNPVFTGLSVETGAPTTARRTIGSTSPR